MKRLLKDSYIIHSMALLLSTFKDCHDHPEKKIKLLKIIYLNPGASFPSVVLPLLVGAAARRFPLVEPRRGAAPGHEEFCSVASCA